jgi:hypothetical protein
MLSQIYFRFLNGFFLFLGWACLPAFRSVKNAEKSVVDRQHRQQEAKQTTIKRTSENGNNSGW